MFIIHRILKQHAAFGCNKKKLGGGRPKLKTQSYFQTTSLASSMEFHTKLGILKSMVGKTKVL